MISYISAHNSHKCSDVLSFADKWQTMLRQVSGHGRTGTGLLSAISYALQRGILLRRENPTGMELIRRSSQKRRVVLRRRNTVVGGKWALPSALLVIITIITIVNLQTRYTPHDRQQDDRTRSKHIESVSYMTHRVTDTCSYRLPWRRRIWV